MIQNGGCAGNCTPVADSASSYFLLMINWYRNWRHTRGYGVHSPYAYMLATEVLRLPRGYSYYDETGANGLKKRSLGMAMLRYKWRFGVSPTLVPAQKALAVIATAHHPVAVVKPPKELIASVQKTAVHGVLFYNRKALAYFPNEKVSFVAYGYRF